MSECIHRTCFADASLHIVSLRPAAAAETNHSNCLWFVMLCDEHAAHAEAAKGVHIAKEHPKYADRPAVTFRFVSCFRAMGKDLTTHRILPYTRSPCRTWCGHEFNAQWPGWTLLHTVHEADIVAEARCRRCWKS